MKTEMESYHIEWMGDRSGIDPHDDNVDIHVRFGDGTSYTATFFTVRNISTLLDRHRESGESAGGTYLWAAEMIIVHELTEDVVERTVAEMVRTGELESAFLRIDPPPPGEIARSAGRC